MKENIHPKYGQTTITCACGNVIETGSTRKDTNSDQDMIEIISRQNSLEEESENLSFIRFDHDLFGVFLR